MVVKNGDRAVIPFSGCQWKTHNARLRHTVTTWLTGNGRRVPFGVSQKLLSELVSTLISFLFDYSVPLIIPSYNWNNQFSGQINFLDNITRQKPVSSIILIFLKKI